MATLRQSALAMVQARPRINVTPPSSKISEFFGTNVFGTQQMKETLAPTVFKKVMEAIDKGSKIDPATAEEIGSAVKTWAIGKGVTHYTHWFQPLTGTTAEKHDSFFDMYAGMEKFKGISFHTSEWPHEPLDLTGKRVGIIGTGATAIQIIPEVAKQAAHLTVFQRRANWAAALNNGPISDQEMAAIRARYDEIFEACARSPAAFEHEPDKRSFYSVSPEERRAFYDYLYDQPGFGIWLSNFPEIFMDEHANAEISAYIADRIRKRVNDPAIAELLIPKDHGFGVQRLPLETKYFETYNRDNVELVNTKATPIERITETGLCTSDREFEFDVIVYATGFDAFTGAYDRIDIRGLGGAKLRDKWAKGPVTYLGMMVNGFPNMIMLGGPQTAAANFPRGSEVAIDWVTPLLQHIWQHEYTRFNVSEASEQAWFDAVKASYDGLLLNKAQSWITGYNSNLDGHEYGHTRYNIFATGGAEYTKHLQAASANDYQGIKFERNE